MGVDQSNTAQTREQLLQDYEQFKKVNDERLGELVLYRKNGDQSGLLLAKKEANWDKQNENLSKEMATRKDLRFPSLASVREIFQTEEKNWVCGGTFKISLFFDYFGRTLEMDFI
jgi:hypothetical protein